MKIKRIPNILISAALAVILLSLLFVSCNKTKTALVVKTEPAQQLINKLGNQDYSIVLNDMDISEDDEHIFYKHKYIILKPQDDIIIVDSTGWENVSEAFFLKHEKDLGMELVSKHGDSFTSTPKPVGFDWAVGNDKYGEWVIDSMAIPKSMPEREGKSYEERKWRYNAGSRFFLMYWMFRRPTNYSVYNSYANNYRGRSAFYGTGKSFYGTSSNFNRVNRAGFFSRKKANTSWNKARNIRISKKSSRFKGGSSSRGRSGGFGK